MTSENNTLTTIPASIEAQMTWKIWPKSMVASIWSGLHGEGPPGDQPAAEHDDERQQQQGRHDDRPDGPAAEQLRHPVGERAHGRGGREREDPGDDDVAGHAPAD